MDANDLTLVFAQKNDVDRVFSTLKEIVERYSCLSFNDVKELVGLPPAEDGDYFYWISLKDAEIKEVSNGWMLILPQPHEAPEHDN